MSVPPTLLLALTGNPLDPPTTLQTLDALRRPLDDQAVVYILALVAWLTWLHLLGCLLTETLQQLRGSRFRPPLTGLLFGANALLASHLIAALLMSSSGTGLSPAPAASHVMSSVAFEPSPSATHYGTAVPLTSESAATEPTGTTPLQRQKVPATEQAGRLPSTVAERRSSISCRVLPPEGRHHDTLWDIAERHLGDGMRWREIYDLNEGKLMPDGQRLTRASLIRPGWILQLPADAKALTIDHVAHPAAPDAADQAAHPTPAPPRTPTDRDVPIDQLPPVELPSQEAPARDPQTSGVPPTVTSQGQQPTPTAAAHDPQPEPQTNSETEESPVAVAGLGTLLLGAAALLAALTRRRKIAARRRPPGVRPTRPAPELLEVERQLRLDARTAEDIAATLRLALLVAADDPDLQVQAVWQHPDGTLELVLLNHDPETAAPAPFETSPRGWRLTPDGQRYLFTIRINGLRRQDRKARLDDQLQAAPDPFPALLPVGTENGSACLVNLEPLGLISLDHSARVETGPQTDARDVREEPSEPAEAASDTRRAIAAAWAQALAGAPWSELTDLYVPAAWASIVTGLARAHSLDPFAPHTEAEHSADPRSPRPVSGQHAAYGQTKSLEAARRGGIGGADTVRIAISLGYPGDQVPDWLAAAAADPLDPNIVLLLDSQPASHPGAHRWTLRADGTLSIPGIADRLTPLRLDTHEHDLLLRLLEHAEDPPQADPRDPARTELLANCPALTRPLGASIDGCGDSNTSATPDRSDRDGHDGEHPDIAPPLTWDVDPALSTGSEQPPSETGDVDDVIDLTTPASSRSLSDEPAEGLQHPDDPDRGSSGVTIDATDLLPAGVVEVRILGPLEVHGATGPAPRKQALDVLVHLALHRRRPVPSDELFEAVWPSSSFNSRSMRNRVSEVRGYIPPGVDFTRGGYQLPDLVQTDWQRFQTLAQGDTHAQRYALQLVRGRPFEGSTLDWMHLEGHFAEMEAAIVDLALDVGQRALRTQQYDLAREACYAGLRGCPYDERLYRIGMEAAAAVGATAEVRELRRRLELILEEEVDDDIQPATDELYRRLETEDELRARRQQRRA